MIRVCNQLILKETVSKLQCLLTSIYIYADDNTLLVLAFKMILVYFQNNSWKRLSHQLSTSDHLLS